MLAVPTIVYLVYLYLRDPFTPRDSLLLDWEKINQWEQRKIEVLILDKEEKLRGINARASDDLREIESKRSKEWIDLTDDQAKLIKMLNDDARRRLPDHIKARHAVDG